MQKIAIIGSSGAGKSHLSTRVGELLGIPVIHLDKIFWLPGWTERSKEEWAEMVSKIVCDDAWILDGNFGGTRGIRVKAADTIIFLDLPKSLCVWRVLKRWATYRQGTRPDMADGCHERFDLKFLKWIWDYPARSRLNVEKLLEHSDQTKRIIRLRSKKEVAAFIRTLNVESHQQT